MLGVVDPNTLKSKLDALSTYAGLWGEFLSAATGALVPKWHQGSSWGLLLGMRNGGLGTALCELQLGAGVEQLRGWLQEPMQQKQGTPVSGRSGGIGSQSHHTASELVAVSPWVRSTFQRVGIRGWGEVACRGTISHHQPWDEHQAEPTLSMLSTRRSPPCAYPLKPPLIIQLLKRLCRVPFLTK